MRPFGSSPRLPPGGLASLQDLPRFSTSLRDWPLPTRRPCMEGQVMAIVGGGIVRSRDTARRAAVVLGLVATACSPSWGQMDFRPIRASTKVYFDTSHTADALLRSADNHGKA